MVQQTEPIHRWSLPPATARMKSKIPSGNMLLYTECEYIKGGYHKINYRKNLRLSSLGLNKKQVLSIARKKCICYTLPISFRLEAF